MKTIIKIVIAALIINACWRGGAAVLRYYRFKDEVQQTALFGSSKSESELQNSVFETARRMQLPLVPESVSVHRTENHTFINAAYTEQIQLVPTYYFPYQFNLNLDVLTMGGSLR
jgi:hypothetical protein